MSSPKVAIVVPARMASTRFPGKPLIDLAGKPMIQWVVEAARDSGVSDQVLVATPDLEILKACEARGIDAVATRIDHLSGTDRIGELAEKLDAEIYINVQGDEPLIDPATIRACAAPLIESEEVQMTSVFCTCPSEEIENPAAVKVVLDRNGFALYFSRHPIPFERNRRVESVKKHIGIYGYRKSLLATYSTWSPSPLELTESLEQLRFLEHGVRIKMSEGKPVGVSVDTPEQAEHARFLLGRGADPR